MMGTSMRWWTGVRDRWAAGQARWQGCIQEGNSTSLPFQEMLSGGQDWTAQRREQGAGQMARSRPPSCSQETPPAWPPMSCSLLAPHKTPLPGMSQSGLWSWLSPCWTGYQRPDLYRLGHSWGSAALGSGGLCRQLFAE